MTIKSQSTAAIFNLNKCIYIHLRLMPQQLPDSMEYQGDKVNS